MRSFIKSHRRNESVTSDSLESELDQPPPLTHSKTTPISSPNIPIISTPPQTFSNSSSISSPKKLLTPIRNLFSSSNHHPKSVNISPSSNDSLNNALHIKGKHKAYKGGNNSIYNSSESKKSYSIKPIIGKKVHDFDSGSHTGLLKPTVTPKLEPSPKFRSSSSPTVAHKDQQYNTTKSPSHISLPSFKQTDQLSITPNAGSQARLEPPIKLVEMPSDIDEQSSLNESNLSLVESKNKFETKQVSFQSATRSIDNSKKPKIVISNDEVSNEADEMEEEIKDDNAEDSDNSSQFSFVRDRKGGRNTSVKYYKTVKTLQTNGTGFTQSNTFNDHDIRYEMDDFSDYDFENNGMVDNYDYNESDTDVKYNNLFDDEVESEIYYNKAFDENDGDVSVNKIDNVSLAISTGTIQTAESYASQESIKLIYHSSPKKFYNKSNNFSIQEIEQLYDNERQESEVNTEDILENYLAISQSPSIDNNISSSSTDEFKNNPVFSSSDNLEQFDIDSPIINGLTEDDTSSHRPPALSANEPNNKLKETNKLFIHKQTPIDDHEDDTIIDFQDSSYFGESIGVDSEKLKLSDTRASHKPISNGIDYENNKRLVNVSKFDNTNKTEANNQIETFSVDIGLGILTNPDIKIDDVDDQHKSANSTSNSSTSRSSRNEMMSILESLGSSSDLKKYQNNVDKSVLQGKESEPTSNLITSNVNNSAPINDKRKSVLELMNILSNLETSQVDIMKQNNEKSDKAKENRKSIIDIISKLTILESTSSDDPESARNRRDSINNSMATLAKLDLANCQANGQTNQETTKARTGNKVIDKLNKANSKGSLQTFRNINVDESKRYSWFNNDETINFKTIKSSNLNSTQVYKPSTLRNNPNIHLSDDIYSDHETNNPSLDEDLIDEINQLPEDFDFEEHEYRNKLSSTIDGAGFLRSNSYNKKPIKTLIENKYQSNKIETLNKTVTFYRSNSSGNSSDMARSRSISRAPSNRSVNSFTSLNEEIYFEDNTNSEVENVSCTSRLISNLYDKSTDSFSRGSYNLSTITESDSPNLK